MRVAFIWLGFDGRYGKWNDGLAAAMRILEQDHDVKYFDFPLDGIHEFKPDVVLYWEAMCTAQGPDKLAYWAVQELPYPKALLFAGGPVQKEWSEGFDLFFVESRINEEEFEALGLPWKRAFGVNTQIFKPMNLEKKYDGFMQATFAGWKRHELFADALGDKGAVAGRKQEHDMNGYNRCVERGVTIFPEQSADEVAKLINQSHVVVNTAEYWGGGQRCSAESIACGVPVIVMSDSPKNMEFVESSGFGRIVDPNIESIRAAVVELKNNPTNQQIGVDYINSCLSERHYMEQIISGVRDII